MAYVKAPIPSEVYHLTQQDKLDDILDAGKIRRFGDTECWFCESPEKMKAYTRTLLSPSRWVLITAAVLLRWPRMRRSRVRRL